MTATDVAPAEAATKSHEVYHLFCSICEEDALALGEVSVSLCGQDLSTGNLIDVDEKRWDRPVCVVCDDFRACPRCKAVFVL